MIVGVPKEIKQDEYRVALTAAGAEEMIRHGHTVLIERGAGLGSGIADADYRRVGARCVSDARAIYARADLIMKVKEPLPPEYGMLRPGQTVFTYFHFAASRRLTRAMIKARIRAAAYETVQTEDGSHPLLTPMSEVAGRMALQEGAKYLERPMEGRGILLAGVPGVAPARVAIIGGGVVGTNAAKIAAGLGANVTILEIDIPRMRYLDDIMPPNVVTLMSDRHNVREQVSQADLVVGAVLLVGARTPVLITREMLKTMQPGAVVVDVSIDQGGCLETSRPTTHHKPTYIVNGIVHYCVTNIPGAVARTSTYALANATLPYALRIADHGLKGAAEEDVAIKRGINMLDGKVTCQAVADTFKLTCHEI